MLLSSFDFEFPSGLIAQHPIEPRDAAKLLVADRKTGEIAHSHFYNLPDFLHESDFLVFNSSRVIPARLFGKINGRGVEVLLISPCRPERSKNRVERFPSIERKGFLCSLCYEVSRNDKENIWQVMAKPGKRLKTNLKIEFSDKLSAKVLDNNKIAFSLSGSEIGRASCRERV